jgi:hypothetical protein
MSRERGISLRRLEFRHRCKRPWKVNVLFAPSFSHTLFELF